jgi:hypothetical protein
MKASNNSKYPVFEADQVLSQKHLNSAVSYLEEQDRLSRTALLGMGIVCGLEISHPSSVEYPNQIKIGCGTAVTSLGYEINWEEKVFNHFHSQELSANFLGANYVKEPFLEPILKHGLKYVPFKNATELLESTSTEPLKTVIPNGFFDDKVVVLLLETALIDEKNCVNTNCDDKGKRMEFTVRPLVISNSDMTKIPWLLEGFDTKIILQKLIIPRYNVPFKNLITGQQVLNGFKNQFDDGFLTLLSDSIKTIYTASKNVLKTTSDFTALNNCKPQLVQIVNAHDDTVRVQYLCDWISDIVYAYNEIVNFQDQNPTFCCFDESQFPFHVVLGNVLTENNYRTPFVKTGNTDAEIAQRNQLNILFERLVLLLKSWSITDTVIKITPSVYGEVPLSKKSIPYYYSNFLDINKKWNADKVAKGNANEILSYQSDKPNYSALPWVQKPLLYDLEPYNFLRIEGHIGKNYLEVLTELSSLKDTYNLPFKTIALNAVDYVGKDVDISKHVGDWGDLEVDYDLARTKVYNITEFVINWITSNKQQITTQTIMTDATIASLKSILNEVKTMLTKDLTDFLPNYKSFYEVFKNLNVLFLFHRFCLLFGKTTLKIIEEDLIDHLDEINELFLEDPFTVIYDEALKRWNTSFKDLFLTTFLQKNKGMEHKAGVTVGGTFILVYADTSIFKPLQILPKFTGLINTIKEYTTGFTFGDVAQTAKVKKELTDSVLLTKTIFTKAETFDAAALKDCKNETENIKANLIKVAQQNLAGNYPLHLQEFFLGNITTLFQFEPLALVDTTAPQKVVLADFYVPYIQNPEGNNVNIVIGGLQTAVGDFDKADFNNEDFNN